jgi:hypothetical protein
MMRQILLLLLGNRRLTSELILPVVKSSSGVVGVGANSTVDTFPVHLKRIPSMGTPVITSGKLEIILVIRDLFGASFLIHTENIWYHFPGSTRDVESHVLQKATVPNFFDKLGTQI